MTNCGRRKVFFQAEAKIFRKYGQFFEKMDGVSGDITNNYHYPNQGGFGWTNAIFYRYIQLLSRITPG